MKIRVSFLRFWFPPALLLVGTLLTASCSDPLSPFQPEVTNAADNFQLQATGLSAVTSTLTYS